MEFNDLYSCSLSGVEPDPESMLEEEDADEMGTLPVGWTKITFERRLPNPEWGEIQAVKDGLVEATLAQLPEGDRDKAYRAVEIQIAAQFAQLEANSDPFLGMREVIYIAPPEYDMALAREFFDLRKRLGLPVPVLSEEEDAPAAPTETEAPTKAEPDLSPVETPASAAQEA
jgi:hypothetical protein